MISWSPGNSRDYQSHLANFKNDQFHLLLYGLAFGLIGVSVIYCLDF